MTPLAPSAANLQRCGRLACRITQIVAQCPKLHFYRSVASEACMLWDSACSGRTWPYWILLDLLFLWVWLKFPALFSTHLFLLPVKSLLSWLSLISPVGFPQGVSSVQKPLQVEMWPLQQVITTALGNQHRQPALLDCTNECCSNLNVWKNYLGISLEGQIWFQRSGVAPRVLHFLQVPRKCQFYCFMDHILNITSWPQPSISQALHLFPEFTAG